MILSISTDTIVQVTSIAVGILIFVITLMIEGMRRREASRISIYQNLELASIELFRFEADHIELTRPLWETNSDIPKVGTAEYNAYQNYICQNLNLFEMAIRFYRQKIVPEEVLGSWVMWFYDICSAPGFAVIWEDVKYDYTCDLRQIMILGLKLSTDSTEGNSLEDFFKQVGEIIGSDAIKLWLDCEHENKDKGKASCKHCYLTSKI